MNVYSIRFIAVAAEMLMPSFNLHNRFKRNGISKVSNLIVWSIGNEILVYFLKRFYANYK